jgi:peptide/nickel transport system permease protein
VSAVDSTAEVRVARAARPDAARSRFWPTTLAILRHAGQLVIVSLVVVIITFLLIRVAPGDAVDAVSGTHGTEASRAALRESLHLNDSLPHQFTAYLGDLAHGDLGNSLVQQGRSVNAIVAARLPVTLAVIAGTVILSLLIGIPLGLLAALSGKRGVDVGVRTTLSLLLASPPFFLGLLLILGPALAFGWFPAGGWAGGYPGNLQYLVLPSLALSGYLVPQIARSVRQAAIDAQRERWYEAALARGLSPRSLAVRHVFKNSLLPVVTLIGLNVGALIAGAVVVEAVFGLPGIGQELIGAINQRDYPLIEGIVLVTALAVVIANLLADIAYRIVDPRTSA